MSIDVARLAGPLKELVEQFSGSNGETRFQEFMLWLKRVGHLVLVTGINRSLSNEQAVEASGRVWWYKNQIELDNAPRYDGSEVEVGFVEFDHDPTTEEVDAIYTDGWVADIVAMSKYMQDKPEATDDRSIAIQWDMKDGSAAFAVWGRSDSGRAVRVDRRGSWWRRRCRFARVRKVSALD